MNIKRAINYSILIYITSFISGILLSYTFKIDILGGEKATPQLIYTSFIFYIITVSIFSWLYFKGKNIIINKKEGILLGLIIVITGFVLDLTFILPYLFIENSTIKIKSYYTDPIFWLSIITTIFLSGLIGWWLKKGGIKNINI